jgi:hypothetical protein
MAAVEIRLVNGDVFAVDGAIQEIEKALSDAARSGQSRLAWFKHLPTDEAVGINPAHVSSVSPSDASDA